MSQPSFFAGLASLVIALLRYVKKRKSRSSKGLSYYIVTFRVETFLTPKL